MRLAIGTVQFGLAYGVAGRSTPVPAPEARAILRRAADLGFDLVDTAPAYGDVEGRLAGLIDGLDLGIISKLPPSPAGLDGVALERWARDAAQRSIERLGPALRALLFHRAEDVLGDAGDPAWNGASSAAAAAGIDLGVSGYEPANVAAVCARRPVRLAQLPGNALDQALLHDPHLPCEVHLRSVFLQGLLLMPEAEAAHRVPAATFPLRRWHRWCAERTLAPLVAALGCAKVLPASHCIVGVDSLEQLEQIAEAWSRAPALHAPELACADPETIDPRRWTVRP
jgi:hypothetical protein